jgi:hypothetical protein
MPSLLGRLDAADRQVDGGRDLEAKGLCDLCEVEVVDVEDLFERVGRVGLQVGAEAVLGGLVEVVILRDELLELWRGVSCGSSGKSDRMART